MAQKKDHRQDVEHPSTQASPSGGQEKRQDRFPVVGIGASAGGLKALEAFFRRVPADAPMAFVVIQHLNPNQESMMPKILSGSTAMRVSHARDGEEVRPNRIYVKPPGKDIRIENGRLCLSEVENPDTVKLPVDCFFRSLAADHGGHSVAVVLSGAGSDGSLGIKDIHEAGGLIMAQEETQAEYNSMPRNAIDTGLVDFILPVEEMPGKLFDFMDHPLVARPEAPKGEGSRVVRSIRQILTVVRHKTGHDFSRYKKNTIRRRIGRRMAVHHLEEMEDYEHYLRQHPEEVQELFRDLMIKVTNFFRDPPVFETLRQKVLPDLIQHRPADDLLRLWVPGCATGEEPYSLAMILVEAMNALNLHLKVKIFATDINTDAIEKAREAVYPDNIAADVSQERLKRFFTRKGDQYKIRNLVRDMVVFAEHDLTRDPPFSKLDLISCRNLFIYMEPELQKKIIPLFHYSLRSGGILVLGTSEGVGGFDDLFDPVEKKLKVFRRTDENAHKYLDRLPPIHMDLEPGKPQQAEESKPPPPRRLEKPDGLPQVLEEVFSAFVPPGVIIDENNEIVYFFGGTRDYISPPAGRPSRDVFKMAREEIRYPILAGLERVRRTGRIQEHLEFRREDRSVRLTLTFMPLQRQDDYVMITFEEAPPPEFQLRHDDGQEDVNGRIQYLEQKLNATQQALQATIEELETSNEELKSANEELQANNEELQSTNEELESSKEELQSINEELETTNTELSRKNEKLIKADDDVKNLLAATDISTIFIDDSLRVKRFNPAATRIFNLLDHDIGRPLSDITCNLKYEGLIDQARDVVDNLNRKELQAETRDGKWLFVRMLPYRSSGNVIEGVVITFSDITHLKRMELESRQTRRHLQTILETLPIPLLMVGEDLEVKFANPAFNRVFALSPEQYQGRDVLEVMEPYGDRKDWQGLFGSATPANPVERVAEMEIRLPEKGKVATEIRLRAIPLGQEEDQQVQVVFVDLAG